MIEPRNTRECLINFCKDIEDCHLTKDDISLLNKHRVEVKYHKGENICKQGAFATHLIYIKKGLTKSYLEDDAKVQNICVNPSHCILGMQSITSQDVFYHSVSALEEVDACLFDMHIIQTIAKRNVGFTYSILTKVNEAQVLLFERFFSLSMKQLNGKMADILICLADRVYNSDSFLMNLSRKDLAELTAMSNESATRVLKEFKDDGIIKLDGKSIIILDRNKLERLSKFG